MINQRRIKNLIYLASGIGYYRVITSGYDGCTEIYAPTTRVGNAIVRAIRELATSRPDLFPFSVLALHEQAQIATRRSRGKTVNK